LWHQGTLATVATRSSVPQFHIVYRAASDAGAVVERAAAGIDAGERVFDRPFPPPALAAMA